MQRIVHAMTAASACLVLCLACRQSADFYVVTEAYGGELIRVPLEVSRPRVSDTLNEYHVASPAGDEVSLLATYGGYGGLSGSPVFRSSGAFFGAVATQFMPGYGGAPIGILPESHIRELLDRGRREAEIPEKTYAVVDDVVHPGNSVGAFTVWGDVMMGVAGAVTYKEGSDLILLGHSYHKRYGARHYNLMRAPVLAAIPELNGYRRTLVGQGNSIGAVLYEGVHGLYARLGVAPPAVAVDIVVSAPGLPVETLRTHIAKNLDLCETDSWRVLNTALQRSEALASPAHTMASCTVTIDGVEAQALRVERENGDGIDKAAQRLWEKIVCPVLLASEQVTLRVVFDDAQ